MDKEEPVRRAIQMPRHRASWLAAILALTLALGAAGCGGDSSDPLEDSSDNLTVVSARASYSLVCLEMVVDGYTSFKTQEEADTDTQALIELARRRPDFEVDGTNMERRLADEASELESCGATEIANHLDRARESL